MTRWVDQDGRIRIATHAYKVGRTFAEELVEVVVSGRGQCLAGMIAQALRVGRA